MTQTYEIEDIKDILGKDIIDENRRIWHVLSVGYKIIKLKARFKSRNATKKIKRGEFDLNKYKIIRKED